MKRAQKGLPPSSPFSSHVILVVTLTLLTAIMTPSVCHAVRMQQTTTSQDFNSMTNTTTTAAPTPMNATVYPSLFPTWSATTSPSASPAASAAPTKTKSSSFTPKPTAYSSHWDSDAPKKSSTSKKIARVIGWMTFLFFSCLAFGMCMSNRYRIFYFLNEVRPGIDSALKYFSVSLFSSLCTSV